MKRVHLEEKSSIIILKGMATKKTDFGTSKGISKVIKAILLKRLKKKKASSSKSVSGWQCLGILMILVKIRKKIC